MLAGMVEVDDLGGTREVFRRKIPDPGRTIADDDDLFGKAQPPPDGLGKDSLAELFGGFDGATWWWSSTRRAKPSSSKLVW
jgi:hypothetical protein